MTQLDLLRVSGKSSATSLNRMPLKIPLRPELEAWGKVALKLGIASSVATLLVQFLNLGYAFSASIAPVLVMGQTRGSTIQTSLNRIKGTLIGTLIGAGCYQLLGDSVTALFLSVSGAVFVSHWLGLPGIKGAAGYVAAISLTLHSNDQPWRIAASQFVALSIGIIVGNLVDDLLWPSQAKASLRHDLCQMLLELRQFYYLSIQGYLVGDYQALAAIDCNIRIVKLIRHIEPLWQEALLEQHQMLRLAASWDMTLHQIWDHVQAMDQIAQAGAAEPQFRLAELDQLADATMLKLKVMSEAVPQPNANIAVELKPLLVSASARLDQLQMRLASSPVELRRFLSFFYHMEAVALSLEQVQGQIWP